MPILFDDNRERFILYEVFRSIMKLEKVLK